MKLSEYRQLCQKGKLYRKDVPFFYRVHRFWSIYITIALLSLGVRANTVTLLSFCTGAVSLCLLCVPHRGFFIAGCMVCYLSFLLDKCDGEVARYRGVFSAWGVYVDELYHLIINGALFTAVGIQLFMATEDVLFLIIGLVTSMEFVLVRVERKLRFVIYCKSEKFRNMSPTHKVFRLLPLIKSRFLGWPSILTYYDMVIYMLVIFAFIGLNYFLYVCVFLYAYILLRRIVISLSGGLEENIASIDLS